MEENKKYEVIKKLYETNGNKTRAAVKLGCTKRHINRLLIKYQLEGKEAFRHKNRGRAPVNTIPKLIKTQVVELYKKKYYDSNIRHYTELLTHEKIYISESSIRNILKEDDLLSPCCHKKTRRKLKKKLREAQRLVQTKEEEQTIKTKLYEVDDPHPRRIKSEYFGEMEQVDASVYKWFGDTDTYLHAAIDDATGQITAAYFDYQETLNGYYHMFANMLLDYGIPHMLYTDRRTVFEYKRLGIDDVEKDTYTQFGYACKQLGVELKSTSVSQAKGKVERLFKTLQSRLPIELRLAGVTTINEANLFLQAFIKNYNEKFALPINFSKSVFDTNIDKEKVNLTLAVISDRTIDCGNCIRYKNKYYKFVDDKGNQKYYQQGKLVSVVKTFDGKLYGNIDGYNFNLLEVTSKEDLRPRKARKSMYRHIPSMEHPWKASTFRRYVYKQKHVA